jgi:alkylation response protein AidB-like acyl-CoA dehydrogenase
MLRRMTNTATDTIVEPDTVLHLSALDEATLEAFRDRAAGFDEAGRFPHGDLADLRRIGWLTAAAPRPFGGFGLDLATLAAEQRRLARYAPATALSTSMHHYWVGGAATLDALGHPFGERILGWAAAGEILASGHAEIGNDMPIALSTTRAERVPGGSTDASSSARSGRSGTGSASTRWTRTTRCGR